VSLLIVGCGYVGSELVRWLRSFPASQNQPITVLTRSKERADLLSRMAVQPLVGHWLQPDTLPEAPQVTRILVSVPHRGDVAAGLSEDSDQTHVMGLKNLLAWLEGSRLDPKKTRLIYLSTTGVFGQPGPRELVTEETPVSPTRHGPKIAVAAEKWLEQNRPGWPYVVLRLAGIYGPDRVPLINNLKSGQPLSVPGQGLLNLIHVTDAARAIAWLLEAENPRPLYLLSDGQPTVRENFYRHLASLVGVAEPKFIPPNPSDTRLRRSTDKQVDSGLFWQESGLQPLYPDFRSGLATA